MEMKYSSIERYERYYAIFREKGFSEHAAQAMAVEALESGEDVKPSTRFAAMHQDEEDSYYS